MGQSIDRKQLLWGVVIGVITVGLMVISYYIGLGRGEENKDDVLGESGEQMIEESEVYVAVRADCSDYEEGSFLENGKKLEKYCVLHEEDKNAFDVLKKLADEDEDFSFDYDESEFGVFINSLNNYHPDIESRFWAFYVNGEMSIVGVSDYMVNKGDELGFRVEEVEL